MAWFKVDDGLWAHPKFAALSDSAQALWLRSGAWCAQQLTDGRVPAHMAPMLRLTEDAARELVEVGLWRSEGSDYQFHDWEEYQPTRAAELEKREKWRERQRQSREKRHANVTRDSRVSHQPDVTRESTSPVPSRPVPSPKESAPAKSQRKPEHSLPEDFTPTPSHEAKAKELGVNLQWELEKFENHHRARDSRFRNWDQALHGWIKRAAEYSTGKNGPPPQSSFDPWAGDWSEDDMRRNT